MTSVETGNMAAPIPAHVDTRLGCFFDFLTGVVDVTEPAA